VRRAAAREEHERHDDAAAWHCAATLVHPSKSTAETGRDRGRVH
jgi:hypothetical protein